MKGRWHNDRDCVTSTNGVEDHIDGGHCDDGLGSIFRAKSQAIDRNVKVYAISFGIDFFGFWHYY